MTEETEHDAQLDVKTEETQSPIEKNQEETPAPTDQGYGDYPPGTIVLAKMKSFPPWPGIVVPNELVPENILKGKPKQPSVLVSASKKKNSNQNQPQDDRLWCVRFLRDDNFMWATVKDIQILTKDAIEKFLNSKKKQKTIRSAYEMALNPPDLEEFIIYGSDGKPIAIDNEADDEDFEDEYNEDDVIDDDADDEDDSESLEDDDDEDLEVKKPTKKNSKKRKATKQPAKKNTKKKAAAPATKATKATKGKAKKPAKAPVEVVEPDTSSDEDWDVDSEAEKDPVAVDIPAAKELAEQLRKKVQQVKKTRIQLQAAFLESKELKVDTKAINASLDFLEELNEVESSLVKTSVLHKVLFDILKRPDLDTKPLKSIRNRIDKIVKTLYDIEISVDEKWDFVEREESVEEGSEEVKAETSVEPSVVPSKEASTEPVVTEDQTNVKTEEKVEEKEEDIKTEGN